MAFCVICFVIMLFTTKIRSQQIDREEYVIRTADGYVFGKADMAEDFMDIVAEARTQQQTFCIEWPMGYPLNVKSHLEPAPIAHRLEQRSDRVKAMFAQVNPPEVIKNAVIEAHVRAAGIPISRLQSGLTSNTIQSVLFIDYWRTTLYIFIWGIVIISNCVVLTLIVKYKRRPASERA